MNVEILPTDRRFRQSPEEGDPTCVCSRCSNRIGEDEFALRAWPEDGSYEYRYCERCQEGMGFRRLGDEEAGYAYPA